ncbi:MAG: NPCBM/NEW2 domain-containing protein, partial [Aeoliella sp.]
IRTEPTGVSSNQGVQVELVDGSILAGTDFRSTEQKAWIAGAVLPVEAPLVAIRSVRLAYLLQDETNLKAQLETEWRDILETPAVGDLIVIRKPDAESLSYVEGVVGDVGPESIQFTLDDSTIEEQMLEVSRTKVFGVVYYHDAKPDNPTSVVVEGPGVRLSADHVRWDETEWIVETRLLGTLHLPTHAISRVDYSNGRVLYLSDLEPSGSEWTPPPGAAAIEPWFKGVARDRGFYSPRLELEYPASSLAPEEATSAGIPRRVVFDKGLALRSRSEQTYRIPRGFSSFRATAGIDPRTQATGLVELRILGDGRVLVKQSIGGHQAPVELQCEVEGMKELAIVVDFGAGDGAEFGIGDIGAGDNLHLANARFTK